MSTGYTAARAKTHDEYIQLALHYLRENGHHPVELPVDGHRPDIRLGNGDYLDIKTSYSNNGNLAIEVNSLQQYARIQVAEDCRVYIVHAKEKTFRNWYVLLPESVRIVKGPQPANGNGSLDDWHLCESGDVRGSRFDDFFRKRAPVCTQPSMQL